MNLEELLTPERCRAKVTGVSKKRVLNTLSDIVAAECPQLESDEVFAALLAREQLGTTGLSNGIAIPHCRLAQCDRVIGVLMTLDQGIDFDAIDAEPVDLVFALIVPEGRDDEHVQALGEAYFKTTIFVSPCDKPSMTKTSTISPS